MAVDLNSFNCKRPSFAHRQVLSRIFQEPHVYFSRGVSYWNLSLNFRQKIQLFSRTQKKTLAGSHVGALVAFVMDNLYVDMDL